MKRYVIGDIHGAHRALVQCLQRSEFNRHEDLLICLGDLCDGWPDVFGVIEELLTVQHLVLLKGNHDQWLSTWFELGHAPDIWVKQGGDTTLQSYKSMVPASHSALLKAAKPYFVLNRMLFVHGGFDPVKPIEQQNEDTLLWDRSLVRTALQHRQQNHQCKLTPYDKVFVGHTPTINFGEPVPIESCGICLMDTGAGWPGGVLTIMDIDTGLYYSSDTVEHLYAEYKGR